jgi:hypothetical protein
MRMKDVKKLLTIGDTKMSEEVKEALKKLGFSPLPEDIKDFGLLIWQVYDYEIYIEFSRNERRYNEGVEKIMELIGEGFYGEVYRVIPCSLYIIHLATSFDEYFDIQVIDTRDLEEVGFLRATEGFVFCGNQRETSKAISELAQITPLTIVVY